MTADRYSRRSFLARSITAAAGTAALSAGPFIGRSRAAQRPNILFIPVDDLRPQLGCYGNRAMQTPAIDRLAGEGTLFRRAYCQVPVCGASRASLLTGIRPTRHRFIDYYAKVDDEVPGVETMPRLFRNAGYTTVSNGKVYHHADDDTDGWSERPWRPRGEWVGRGYLTPENISIARRAANGGRGPAFEAADVPDNAYSDGMIADKTIADLERLAGSGAPFFLAAGFMKPHLPFCAPSRYWDRYRREDIDLADNPFRPEGAPDAAMHNWVELRKYIGIPPEGPMPDDLARSLVHGYYAATSYADAQVGRVLDALDRLGLAKSTIVVLWGDHGWQLGEHGLWCKHCTFENALHAPLIVRAPGMRHGDSQALVEFVDIFPSLCTLAGLDTPAHLEGDSFVPLMENPSRQWKEAAFSRYFDGDSVKTARYRYTEWRRENMLPGNPYGTEQYAATLYDHENDPHENVNIAGRVDMAGTVERLSGMLRDGWREVRPG